MSELNEKQLEALAEERAKIFTPGWFADLLGARLAFGDTFWLGLIGIWLYLVPAVVLIAGLLYALAPAAMLPFLRVISAAYGVWCLAVLRALWAKKARGGMGLAGLAACLALAITAFGTAATL